MGYGMGEQLEPKFWKQVFWNPDKPWQMQKTMWRRWSKKAKIRKERRRARINAECEPEYKRFYGSYF